MCCRTRLSWSTASTWLESARFLTDVEGSPQESARATVMASRRVCRRCLCTPARSVMRQLGAATTSGDAMLDSAETPEPPEEHAPSTPRDGFSRLWRDPQMRVLGALLVVVAAVAIAAPYLPGKVGLTKGSAGHHAPAKAAASGTAGAKPRPASTAPIPPTPEQQAASINVPAALAAALRAWNTGSAGRALFQITNDVGMALQSGGSKSYNVMRSTCANLATSIDAAGNLSPIPDAAMQSEYSAALSVLAKAASDCRSAISVQPEGDEYVSATTNPTVLQLAQSELSSGIKSLADITIVINAATPHT